ncbi:LPS biosynthesis protein, partial [Helicobacter pylori]
QFYTRYATRFDY